MRNAAGGGAAVYEGARAGERRVRAQGSECVILECVCGERFILVGPVAVQQSESVLLECDCGEKFTLAGRVTVHGPDATYGYREARDFEEEPRYSGLEGCLEWLEGKEARQEYYARLERAASR